MACVAVPEDRSSEADPVPEGFSSADVILATLDEVDDRLWTRLGARHSGPASPLATSGPMAAGYSGK